MALLRTSVSFSRNLVFDCVPQINTTIIHVKLISCELIKVDGRWIVSAWIGAKAPLLAGSSQQPEFTGHHHHPIIV